MWHVSSQPKIKCAVSVTTKRQKCHWADSKSHLYLIMCFVPNIPACAACSFFLSFSWFLSLFPPIMMKIFEVRIFSQLFQPSKKKKGSGWQRHAAAFSFELKSFQNGNFNPFSVSRLPITTLSAFWKILSRGLPATKCALNRSISEPDHWLRRALVSNNTVCSLWFQMTEREMGTINTFYLLTHTPSLFPFVSLTPRLSLVMVWSSDPSLSHWTPKVFNLAELWLCFLFLLSCKKKKNHKCWWPVLFLHCTAALTLTSSLGLICVWMCLCVSPL